MTSERAGLRVLYVINGLGTGGAERSLADLIDPLGEQGIELVVACLYRREEGVESLVRSKTDVHFLPSGRVGRLLGLRRLIEDLGPDLIHTTIFESDLLGRIAAIGTDAPVISSVVNTSYQSAHVRNPDVSRWKLEVARWLDGLTARHLTHDIHTLTNAAADAAMEALGLERGRIRVIGRARSRERLGNRSEDRREATRNSLDLEPGSFAVLSVGRREHQKGQIYAIEALAALQAEIPELNLMIAGRTGSAAKRLQTTTEELGLTDTVRFLGHRQDIPDLMVAADLLVFPSLYEGFGGTLVEAMALGLPVVASDIPVLREVLEDAAVFFPTASATGLATAIRTLHANPEQRLKLAQRGIDRFETEFTIDRVAGQTADFYREVARSGRRGQ